MGKWIKVAAASLVGMALLVGVMGTAMADTGTPTTANARHGGGEMGLRFQGIPDSLGSLLGLDRAQIMEQRHDGQSLVDIAKNAPNPADENTLIDTIVADRQKAVDQRVADGKLTQEQATQMMERVKEQVKTMVEQTQTGPNRPTDGWGLGQGMSQHGGKGVNSSNGGNGGNCPLGNQASSSIQ